jgi:hypothetical protein
VNEYELVSRKETRVAQLAEKIGPRNLVSLLWLGQAFLNLLPPVRSQGNKFFCAISKRELQPRIEMRDGRCYLKKENERSSWGANCSEAKYEPSKNYEIWMQWYGRVRRG